MPTLGMKSLKNQKKFDKISFIFILCIINRTKMDYLIELPRKTIVCLSRMDVKNGLKEHYQIQFDWWVRGNLSHYQTKKLLSRFILDMLYSKIYETMPQTNHIKRHRRRMEKWTFKYLQFFETSDLDIQNLKTQEELKMFHRKMKSVNVLSQKPIFQNRL